MEQTYKNALAFAKREWKKYGYSNYPDVDEIAKITKYKYFLREADEVPALKKALAKWETEHYYDLKH